MGLDGALYNVSESDEAVEICVTASSGNSQCPYLQPFQVTLSTARKSAGTVLIIFLVHSSLSLIAFTQTVLRTMKN